MKLSIAIAAAALLASPMLYASSNDIGFNPYQANLYCENLAEGYQVLDEDRSLYMSRCIAEYRESPPAGQGSDISPHAAGY